MLLQASVRRLGTGELDVVGAAAGGGSANATNAAGAADDDALAVSVAFGAAAGEAVDLLMGDSFRMGTGEPDRLPWKGMLAFFPRKAPALPRRIP